MNNILVYLVLGLVACVAIGLAIAWVYNEFFRDTSPKTELRPSRKNTDISLLKKNVNYGAVGEPLLFYGKPKKKKLKADPYRLELPNYTCSCEKRGLVVGVSGTGKTNYIFSQIVDWSKSVNPTLLPILSQRFGELCTLTVLLKALSITTL